jgi:hypothetical protein
MNDPNRLRKSTDYLQRGKLFEVEGMAELDGRVLPFKKPAEYLPEELDAVLNARANMRLVPCMYLYCHTCL